MMMMMMMIYYSRYIYIIVLVLLVYYYYLLVEVLATPGQAGILIKIDKHRQESSWIHDRMYVFLDLQYPVSVRSGR